MAEQSGFARSDEHRQRWRQLNQRLWAGREDDRPIGTIEQGRRFTWIGPDGDPHPGFSSLGDAQRAARHQGSLEPDRTAPERGSRVAVAIGLGAAGTAFVGLGWLVGMVMR